MKSADRAKARTMTAWIWIALTAVTAAASGDPAASKCSGEHRRLDFWAGDWDAYEVGGANPPVARARIEAILGGCALKETYEQNDGTVGQSMTAYDASRNVWHQTWMTNRGSLLQIEGRFEGNRLILQGPRISPEGRSQIVRGVWLPEGEGVRETAQISSDSGATWQPWFDLVFRPRRERRAADADSAGEAKAVDALDAQYQAAVKNNDAVTMDRILADDFILVTGRGKVFNKTDLLNEARSGRMVYERQDDEGSRKVRVWGDTAVVTALLWVKGTQEATAVDYKLWFSDTYVRTSSGWKYVFGQASIPLPLPK